MNRQEIQRLDSESWHSFGNKLLNKENKLHRKKFLESCLSKIEFQKFISENLQSLDLQVNSTVDFDRFTENEFYSPPEDTQVKIWKAFEHHSPETMSDVCFWGYVILELIEKNSVEPAWLATNSGGVPIEGAIAIEEALGSLEEKEVDQCIRRVLRSMCNPQPRGKRIVYFDFSLGKSWWRYYWANEMSKLNSLELNLERILEIMDLSIYQVLAERMQSSRSYISFPNVFGGILLFLNSNYSTINSKTIEKIVNNLAYLIIWKSVEMLEPSRVCEQINKIHESLSNKPSELH